MGLDLWHVRPSVKRDSTSEHFYLYEFEDFPEFIERHKDLFTEMIEPHDFFTIRIFSDDKSSKQYQKFFGSQNEAYLVGNIEKLADEITQIETDNCLWKDESFITTGSSRDDMGILRGYIYHTDIIYPISYSKKKVIYYESIGYQRKGMNPKFYEDFNNCKLYLRKEHVLKASQYLDVDDQWGPTLNQDFKESFIDNFIEGESIFFASW